MLRYRLIVGLVCCVVASASFAQAPPSGWRLPMGSDFPDHNRFDPTMAHVRADFNGDGYPDHARILYRSPKANSNGVGVFVFLMRADGQQETFKLGEYSQESGEFALNVVRKDCYRNEATSTSVCLKHPGLVVGEIEFGNGTLYWFEKGEWKRLEFSAGEISNIPQ